MEKTLGDKMADKVASFGAFLSLLGILSCAFYIFDYNVRLLMWVDLWGPVVGWIIRVGFIAGGGALFVVAKKFDKTDTPEAHAQAAREVEAAEQAMKRHPRTQKLFVDLGHQLQTSWEPPADPDTYRIRLLLWQDDKGRWFRPGTEDHYGPDDPGVTNAAVFLEREKAPRRLYVLQHFASREVTQQEPPDSSWDAMVGG